MLANWENKFRAHWPHHYRDVLDKINSPLGMVVVNDTINDSFGCERPIVRLERSFKLPTIYKIIVQDPTTSKILLEKKYQDSQLAESIEEFVNIIGGWEDKK
ncbi:MAG: hypothetical protein SFU25_07560 [Candidatus Caenarcaniphilales bacterium]|nr:hypothetical protein [Candidatus Caenarcaniphilales bacterium]